MTSLPKLDQYIEVTAEALSLSKRNYYWLALQSYIVDILSFGVLFSTWFLMDHLTKNELSYAPFSDFEILTKLPKERHDELFFTFPHVAKCTVTVYGTGGSTVPRDVICALPQNDFFEKIFIVDWLFLSLMILFTVGIFGLQFLAKVVSICISCCSDDTVS